MILASPTAKTLIDYLAFGSTKLFLFPILMQKNLVYHISP